MPEIRFTIYGFYRSVNKARPDDKAPCLGGQLTNSAGLDLLK